MHIELHPIRQDEPQSRDRNVLAICEGTKQVYKYVGFNPPWIGYLARIGPEVVGTCAFKSAPRGGRVEIVCATMPGHERRGIATEMARKLIHVAQEADPQVVVFAQASPRDGASIKILQKAGFKSIRSFHDPQEGEVLEWVFERCQEYARSV